MLRWLRRFSAFAALPVLATVGSLLALPLVARNVSAEDWAALTVGQSLGLVTSIVIGLGWPVIGASRVAQGGSGNQRRIYAESLASRGVAAAVLGPCSGAMAAWLAPGEGRALTCALMAMATTLSGLSIAWFCVGKSSPREIAIFEIVPRILGLVAGGLGVAATGNASLYPTFIAVSMFAGLGIYTVRILGTPVWKQLVAASPVSTLRGQARLALIETSAASFTSGLGFLTGFSLAVSELAGLGSGDRMSQVALQAVAALSNTLHPWVAVAMGQEFRRRALRAGAAHVAGGLLLLLGMGLFGPSASALLFGRDLMAPSAVCWGLGAYLLCVSLQTVACRHILVTRGETTYVIRANVMAAALGVPMVLIGASTAGAPGAVAGMATGELAIFVLVAPTALRSLRIAVASSR